LVAKYKAEAVAAKQTSNVDIIKVNRSSMKNYESEKRVQVMEQKALSASQRRATVLAAGEKKEMARIQDIESRTISKEVSSRSNQLSSRDGKKTTTAQQLADRWFLATALASRLAIVKAFLEEKHRMEEKYRMEENGAVAIQRSWRLYKESKRERIVNVAFGVIANMIKRVFSLSYHEGYSHTQREEKAYRSGYDSNFNV
jgi:hypothetical protein